MKTLSRLLYVGCFLALAAVTALALDRAFLPSISSTLVRSVTTAAFCAAPALIWRRLWLLSVPLLPLGCYLLLRTVVPPSSSVEGLGSQLTYYAELLQAGAASFKGAAYPLYLARDPGLSLFVVFCTYWIGAAAALSAFTLRRPLVAVVLLLPLLGFGLTVDGSARIAWMAVLFAALSALLFVLCRTTTRHTWRLGDWITGGAVGIAGSFIALGLLLAAPSVAAQPWRDWRAWDPFGVGGSSYAFDRLADYADLLDPAKDLPVMRVSSSEPSYWRAGALGTFTGDTWNTSHTLLSRLDATAQPDGLFVYSLPDTELRPSGRVVLQSFQVQADVATDHLFVGGNPQSLTLSQDLTLHMDSVRAVRVSTAVATGLDYAVTAVIPDLAPVDMVGLGRAYPLADARLDRVRTFYPYVELPFPHLSDLSADGPDPETAWRRRLSDGTPDLQEWEELYGLNQTIIGDATDPYQISLRIERYLRRFYSYTLTPPVSDFSSPYAGFLFDTRQGYCQHFAGAMAVLLRFNDIPSRVAVGFATGDAHGSEEYLVSTNDVHAWVEAYFPTVGWVDLDPTPGRFLPTPGVSSTSPGFSYPFLDIDSGAWTAPRQTDSVPDARQPLDEVIEESSPQKVATGSALALWLPWAAGLPVLFVIWPFARSYWRRRHLRRGEVRDRLRASLRLLRRDLASYGVPITSAYTLEETLDVLRGAVGLEPNTALVARVDAILFGGRQATTHDVRRVEALRRDVVERLRKNYGWARAWYAWYGIPRASGT